MGWKTFDGSNAASADALSFQIGEGAGQTICSNCNMSAALGIGNGYKYSFKCSRFDTVTNAQQLYIY